MNGAPKARRATFPSFPGPLAQRDPQILKRVAISLKEPFHPQLCTLVSLQLPPLPRPRPQLGFESYLFLLLGRDPLRKEKLSLSFSSYPCLVPHLDIHQER